MATIAFSSKKSYSDAFEDIEENMEKYNHIRSMHGEEEACVEDEYDDEYDESEDEEEILRKQEQQRDAEIKKAIKLEQQRQKQAEDLEKCSTALSGKLNWTNATMTYDESTTPTLYASSTEFPSISRSNEVSSVRVVKPMTSKVLIDKVSSLKVPIRSANVHNDTSSSAFVRRINASDAVSKITFEEPKPVDQQQVPQYKINKPCKFEGNGRTCNKGTACRFIHYPQQQQQMRQQRQQRPVVVEDRPVLNEKRQYNRFEPLLKDPVQQQTPEKDIVVQKSTEDQTSDPQEQQTEVVEQHQSQRQDDEQTEQPFQEQHTTKRVKYDCNKGLACENRKCSFKHPTANGKPVYRKAAIDENAVPVERSKKIWFCKNLIGGKECNYGDNCKFAHSHEEVKANVTSCKFGEKCQAIEKNNANKYVNVSGRKCIRLHPRERISNFIDRTQ